VVAEDVRAYKPDSRPFHRALIACGARAEEVLHVAFGFKYDIRPAQDVGVRTAWVNRAGEPWPGDVRPEHEWRDLWGLAELAESRA
jgi:FMN phosphatase YigB (HAD superfamily)